MFARLAALFIILPIVELIILIWLGNVFSFWPTVGIIVVTGLVGAWLARVEGRAVLRSIQVRLQKGELPSDQLVDGLLVVIAGALMVTPGLITDTTGMLLLVPPVRRFARNRIRRWFTKRIQQGSWQSTSVPWTDVNSWAYGEDVIDVAPEPDDLTAPTRLT